MAHKPQAAPKSGVKRAAPAAPPPLEAPPAKPCWRRRWAMIRVILGFCAALSLYVVVLGPDDRLRETALLALLALGGSVALGYLGFATQDDRNWLDSVNHRLARRGAEGRR